jgi:hypothetical protein
MHGGANLLHPAMHGGGVGPPRGSRLAGLADVDPAADHGGVGGPRHGSWRGMPAPFKTSREPTLRSFLSLSHPEALSFSPSLTPERLSSLVFLPVVVHPLLPPRRPSPLRPAVPGPFPSHPSFEEGNFLLLYVFIL